MTTEHDGTTEEPRELCPCCGGHGMVRQGTASSYTVQSLDSTGAWLGACLLILAFLLGGFASFLIDLL